MTIPDSKNHPLEELLDIETGSTPNDNPFERDNNALTEIEEEEEEDEEEVIDSNEFYDTGEPDKSVQNLMANAPFVDFYDDIDKKVEQKFQEVYNIGMQAFSRQMQDSQIIEPKYRARNLEVAAQYLRIALDSAKDSGHQKANKDKIKVAEKKVEVDKNGKINNNLIVDRNDLIKALLEAEDQAPKVVNPDVVTEKDE